MALTDPAVDPAGGGGASAVGRIARSGLWSMVAHAFAAGSMMAVSIIIGRSAGSAELGRFTFYIWILRVAPIVLALGVPTALTRFVSEHEGKGEPRKASGLFVTVRRFHLLLLAAPAATLAALWAGDRLEADVAVLLLAGITAGLLTLDYEALLIGLRRFRDLGVVAAAVGATQVVAALVGVAVGVGWKGFIGLFVGAAFGGVVLMGAIGHRWLSDIEPEPVSRDERRRFSRFAWAVALAVTADAFLWGRPELLFLQRYRPATDLGLYSAALRLAALATMVPLVAARSLLPEFSFQQAAGRVHEMRGTFRQVCTLLMAVTAPLAIGGAAVAPSLVAVVFGPDFTDAGLTTAILLAGSLVNALSGPTAAAVLIGPRPRLVAEVGVAAIVVNIVLAVALIPTLGPEGAAIATVAVQAASVLVGAIYAWRWMGLPYPVVAAARVLACAAVSAAGAAVISRVVDGAPGLLLAIAAAAASYGALLVATKTVDLVALKGALLGRTPASTDGEKP